MQYAKSRPVQFALGAVVGFSGAYAAMSEEHKAQFVLRKRTQHEIFFNTENPLHRALLAPEQVTMTNKNGRVVQRAGESRLETRLSGYTPSWFYIYHLLANAASCIIPLKPTVAHEHVRFKAVSEVGGDFTYEVIRHPNGGKKVLFVVPGMNCSIKENHLNSTLRKALKSDFNVVVVNPVTPDYATSNLEMINYGENQGLGESIGHVREMFGDDAEIFAVGFSLGSNHLMRHLGSHEDCDKKCRIKAAVSICGAYDILSNSIRLNTRLFGVYGNYMKGKLQETFSDDRFKQIVESELPRANVSTAQSILHFDNLVRARYFGYSSAQKMYRKLSCDQFIPGIATPMLVLATKDDAITDFNFVPADDIKRNPNLILATLAKGGHCDLQYTDRNFQQKELAPVLIMDYFKKVD